MTDKIKFLKNFFEPIFLDKTTTVKIFLSGINENILAIIIPLYFIPKIVGAIELKNFELAFLYSSVSLGIFILLMTLRSIFMYYWYWAMNVPYEKVLHKKYLPELLMIDSRLFDRHGTGYHLSKYNAGIGALAFNTREFVHNFPSVLMNFVFAAFVVFGFGFIPGVLYVLSVIILIILICYLYVGEVKLLEDSNELFNRISENIARIIMSKQEIVFADQINKENNFIESLLKSQFGVEKSAYKYSIPRMGIIWYFTIFVAMIVFFLDSLQLINLSAQEIALTIMLMSTLIDSVSNTYRVTGSIFENYNRVSSFMEMIRQDKIKNYSKGREFEHGNGSVELRNINFSYGKERVLEDFNLKIKGRTKVALVGKSGSGKTTIAKLISGYLKIEDKNTGEVLMDDQNINDLSLKSYYKYIGYLTQEPMVFDGTIRENLMYSIKEKEVTEEKIREALDKARCDFVHGLEKGLGTHIGEKGIRLSGGERQRLAIAKLFLKDPEIIILDEPTSALDSFSEEIISRSLDELFAERTVIIIAHRLQTVKKADEIIVLENGKILERGSHGQLIQKNGNYAKMLELQSGF